jgi:hypothetical protein
VCHSAGWIKDRLPDGRSANIVRHESIDAFLECLQVSGKGIHVIAVEDAGEVVNVGWRMAELSLELNGGDKGTPVIVFIDEAVAADDIDTYRLSGNMKKLIALRRHKNVGLVFTTQSPQLCHYQMFALCTELALFRVKHRKALNKLLDVGIDPDIVERMPMLPNHHYIHWRADDFDDAGGLAGRDNDESRLNGTEPRKSLASSSTIK